MVCGQLPSAMYTSSTACHQTNTSPGCNHTFCDPCVASRLTAANSQSFRCPVCAAAVSKKTLKTGSADLLFCGADAEWRKNVRKVFNRTSSSFPSLREYNDYLEEVECLIYSLATNDSDAPASRARLKAEAEASAEAIQQRRSVALEQENDVVERINREGIDTRKAGEKAKTSLADEAAMKERYKREKNELAVGDRDDISKEVKEAHRLKFKGVVAKTADAYDAGSGKGDGGVILGMTHIVKVSIPGGQLKSKQSVFDQVWSWEGREKRMLAMGAIVPNSKEQQEFFWEEAMDSLFLEPRGD